MIAIKKVVGSLIFSVQQKEKKEVWLRFFQSSHPLVIWEGTWPNLGNDDDDAIAFSLSSCSKFLTPCIACLPGSISYFFNGCLQRLGWNEAFGFLFDLVHTLTFEFWIKDYTKQIRMQNDTLLTGQTRGNNTKLLYAKIWGNETKSYWWKAAKSINNFHHLVAIAISQMIPNFYLVSLHSL